MIKLKEIEKENSKMACVKKCKCGKVEKSFQFLEDGDIDFFTCDDCPMEKESESKSEEKPGPAPQVPEMKPESELKQPEETKAQRKARLAAEKKAAEANKAEKAE